MHGGSYDDSDVYMLGQELNSLTDQFDEARQKNVIKKTGKSGDMTEITGFKTPHKFVMRCPYKNCGNQKV